MTRRDKKAKDDDVIYENLKRVYDKVLNEEVPDKFRELLDQLKSADDEGKPKGSE